jgi:uncharacterized membrane protein
MTNDTLRESQLRSVLKAITYRITGTLATASMTLAVTGDLQVALAVGSLEPIVKIGIYYAHERLWQRVPIGTIRRLAARPHKPAAGG